MEIVNCHLLNLKQEAETQRSQAFNCSECCNNQLSDGAVVVIFKPIMLCLCIRRQHMCLKISYIACYMFNLDPPLGIHGKRPGVFTALGLQS